MSAKLTKAQIEGLQCLREQTTRDGWMFAPPIRRATLASLRRADLVEFEHDGGRYLAHRINDAGRLALAEIGA